MKIVESFMSGGYLYMKTEVDLSWLGGFGSKGYDYWKQKGKGFPALRIYEQDFLSELERCFIEETQVSKNKDKTNHIQPGLKNRRKNGN